MSVSRRTSLVLAVVGLLLSVGLLNSCGKPKVKATPVLTIAGTHFFLDGQPFPYTGVSFFNAIYNPALHESPQKRLAGLAKFRSYGINVLRIWAQWDNRKGFVDTSPQATLYQKSGTLREPSLKALHALLEAAAASGMVVELCLFSHESDSKKKESLTEEARLAGARHLAENLKPYRHVIFQIWNERSLYTLALLRAIKEVDPQRIVTSAPGFPGDMGSDEENTALDFLSPHTVRQGGHLPHWEAAPLQISQLLAKFRKPVVDDEPARNGTVKFGGPGEGTFPKDHIEQIRRVREIGGYVVYHHDMFQLGKVGDPSVPPNGIPDPEFSAYHREVFEYLRSTKR